ncbi:MAG: hypothetical protein M1457_11340 [bacterium]|nr:hypothetical protein [bacterium]
MTPVYGSRIRNPFLADGGETPYIVALAGGPEAFGLLDGYTAASPEFAAITSTAPSGATVALVRRSVGPAGLSDTYPGFSVLFYINISGGDLALPTLGVGDRDYAQPLQLGGFTRRVEFGGDGGISPLAVLPAGAIYATLVPDGSITYTFGYTAGPNVVRRRVVSLVLNTPVYLTTQSASREWLDYE